MLIQCTSSLKQASLSSQNKDAIFKRVKRVVFYHGKFELLSGQLAGWLILGALKPKDRVGWALSLLTFTPAEKGRKWT